MAWMSTLVLLPLSLLEIVVWPPRIVGNPPGGNAVHVHAVDQAVNQEDVTPGGLHLVVPPPPGLDVELRGFHICVNVTPGILLVVSLPAGLVVELPPPLFGSNGQQFFGAEK